MTLGNIVAGTLLVAGIYWFVYLRSSAWTEPPRHEQPARQASTSGAKSR